MHIMHVKYKTNATGCSSLDYSIKAFTLHLHQVFVCYY